MEFLEKQLVVKKSTLEGAGKGLFTKKLIPKGTRILEYKGRVSSWKEAYHDGGDNGYLFFINRNNVIDARVDLKSLGRYVNDARGLTKVKGITNNCEYTIEKKRVYIDAVKDIPAGAELFVPYGKEYWDVIRENIKIDQKEARVKNKTKAKKKTAAKKL